MSERRYTICTYYPSLYHREESCDFAVIVASADGLTLAGVPLSACGVTAADPFGQAIISNSFEVMARRVERGLDAKGAGSYLDALDRIVEANFSNILYRRFVNLDRKESTEVIAREIVRTQLLQSAKEEQDGVAPSIFVRTWGFVEEPESPMRHAGEAAPSAVDA